MRLHFCNAESTFSYFGATRGYVKQFGKPVAFNSDKASVLRVNAKEPRGRDGVTQFGRALGDINVDIICANSAPAKGRVERANLTLQDRLVKELRLREISSMDAANAFALEFLADFNARFARAPHNAFNAHRPLLPSENLDEILSWQETRKVSLSLTVNYQRRLYLLVENDQTRALRGKSITVVELKDGTVQMRDGTVSFPYTEFDKVTHQPRRDDFCAARIQARSHTEVAIVSWRKIEDERDAVRCLRAAARKGMSAGAWARAHGIDGRSLHAWKTNIGRRGTTVPPPLRRRKALPKASRVGHALVELVPASTVPGVGRYALVLGSARVEFGDDVSVATLRRVFEVLRSCRACRRRCACS